MTPDYLEQLAYTLPAGTPKDYGEVAISVLSDIEFSAPDFYQEFLRSDIVLTLSGVRALSSDITFSSHIENGRQTAQLRKVLESHNITLLTFGSEQIILNIEALVDLELRYPFTTWSQIPDEITPDSFRAWVSGLVLLIQNELQPLPGQEIEPTHIWFGMLHGYPGQAILDYAGKTPFMIKTDIENADAYSGPSVNYLIGKTENGAITKHIDLWSRTLSMVYAEP